MKLTKAELILSGEYEREKALIEKAKDDAFKQRFNEFCSDENLDDFCEKYVIPKFDLKFPHKQIMIMCTNLNLINVKLRYVSCGYPTNLHSSYHCYNDYNTKLIDAFSDFLIKEGFYVQRVDNVTIYVMLKSSF